MLSWIKHAFYPRHPKNYPFLITMIHKLHKPSQLRTPWITWTWNEQSHIPVPSKEFKIIIWNKVMQNLQAQHSSVTCPTYPHHYSYHSSPFTLLPELPSWADHSSSGPNPKILSVSLKVALFPVESQIPTPSCCLIHYYERFQGWGFFNTKSNYFFYILSCVPDYSLGKILPVLHILSFQYPEFTASSRDGWCYLLQDTTKQNLSHTMHSYSKGLVTKEEAIMRASPQEQTSVNDTTTHKYWQWSRSQQQISPHIGILRHSENSFIKSRSSYNSLCNNIRNTANNLHSHKWQMSSS